ncbi:hypothetical protein IHE44_0007894, partial [Lamprotornis superbus]
MLKMFSYSGGSLTSRDQNGLVTHDFPLISPRNIHYLIHHSLQNAKIPGLNSMMKNLINVAASALQVSIGQEAAVTLWTPSAAPAELKHTQPSGIILHSALPAHHPAGKNQTCTRSQDRICSCPPHKYCVSKLDEYCEVCRAHKKCGKGYRVSRRGTDSTDTECKPCPPGTFSPEESYNTSCIPHTVCKSVAVPGNSRNDTVCSDSGTATVLSHTILNQLLTQSSDSHKPEIVTQPVRLNSGPDLSHITGAVAGPLLLVLIIAILGYCLVSKKKALGYSAPATEADLPFPPPEKQCDKKVRDTELQNSKSSELEQQHLLETSGSSSSILNNPAGSASISVLSKKNHEKKNPGGFQQQHSPPEGSKLQSGDRHNSASSEHSANGGTQVNVMCIVKFCNPDCSSQCPEQTGSTSRDYGHTPCYSPTGEETLFSKEENALKKETEIHIAVENKDNLLQDLLPEEKKVPPGIQDAEMKIKGKLGWNCCYLGAGSKFLLLTTLEFVTFVSWLIRKNELAFAYKKKKKNQKNQKSKKKKKKRETYLFINTCILKFPDLFIKQNWDFHCGSLTEVVTEGPLLLRISDRGGSAAASLPRGLERSDPKPA